MDLGSGIRDPGSGKILFRIPDPGVKKAPIPDPDSQHWVVRICGSGPKCHGSTSIADPWHFGVDPDPRLWLMDLDADPDLSIFIIDLQDAKKNQCYGSGSGFTRSPCFWASWIQIRIHQSEVWILLSPSKKSMKNIDSYCFVTSFWHFIFENDVHIQYC